MSEGSEQPAAVDLSNCDSEPIHVPGAIQPHGVLLGFDAASQLVTASANAERQLQRPTAGLQPADLGTAIERAVATVLVDAHADVNPLATKVGGREYDAIVHPMGGTVFVELEPVPTDAPERAEFAWRVQRALDMLQRANGLSELLEIAAREVRRLNGFDRVMAYRFRHDDSGEVVAEERRGDLEPFLGLRYPATDIPAQARRLYLENPLRLITDVRYRPAQLVPAMHPETGAPFDLSHSVLRSVSPIHVEYLTNMGVAASMSVSIVVAGRLWGLLACHHMSPRFVTYAVRMACRLLSQTLGLLVERAEAKSAEARKARAAEIVHALARATRTDDDPVRALTSDPSLLLELADASGVAVSFDSRIETLGAVPPRTVIAELLTWIEGLSERDLLAFDDLAVRRPGLAPPAVAAGLMAVRYDAERRGYVLWFRREEVETVRWAGNPDKLYPHGKLGPRLSPRGSFAEYVETVRNRSRPWSADDRHVASALRAELVESVLRRAAEFERTRDLFIGIVGHDLRGPLNAISLAASMISAGSNLDRGALVNVGSRLTSSTDRMRRMIDELLDFSRLQAGLGLGLTMADADVHALVRQIVDEGALARPGAAVQLTLSGPGHAQLDPDRFAQLFANLLSNARHHGDPSAPVVVDLRGDDERFVLTVENHGPTIPDELLPRLFDPYKPSSLRKASNKGGLGLGLYIVKQIIDAHGGTIVVRSADGHTAFEVTFPRRR